VFEDLPVSIELKLTKLPNIWKIPIHKTQKWIEIGEKLQDFRVMPG